MPRQAEDCSELLDKSRLQQGYVIILPGIEGYSRWNRWIRRGLLDARVPYGIEIHDWTRGPLHYVGNLRDGRRHREQAQRIAEKVQNYRREHPGAPVYLIGHSGGAAMSAFALKALPPETKVTGVIMLVGALSPEYDLKPVLRRTTHGIWNYSAPGDLFFVGIGTTLLGTCDGRHTPASGLIGFHHSAFATTEEYDLPPFHQLWYRWGMLREFNFGGHLSCVNPRFVRRWIAPIILESDSPGHQVSPHWEAARERSRNAESPHAEQQPVR